MIKKTIFTALLSLSSLQATEFLPWFGPDKVFEFRNSIEFEYYNTVHNATGPLSSDRFLTFYHGSLSMSPCPEWSIEGEVSLGYTEAGGVELLDHAMLTARYLWLNDVVGDCISLSTGASFFYVSGESIREPITPHHGNYGIEGHVSIGSEHSCRKHWTIRYWSMVGAGTAFEGDMWIRLENAFEWQVSPQSDLIRLFANGYMGLGGKNFSPTTNFRGYEAIKHRSIDVGIRLTHWVCFDSIFSLEYAYRVYSRNYPQDGHQVKLEWNYLIGL